MTRKSIQVPLNHPTDLATVTHAISQESSAASSDSEANHNNNRHMKRSRDEEEITETSSQRSIKSARNETTSLGAVVSLALQEPGCGPAHYILGLSAWLETVSEKEKASEVAMEEVLQRCERQRATITSMQGEKESLDGRIYELQDQRDTSSGAAERATVKIGELEAECVQFKLESQAYKEQMDTLRVQLEEAVEKGRKATETETLLEDERKAGRLVIADLDSRVAEIPELRRQYEAAVKNADESRKQRNETQNTLNTSQAENERLVNVIETMTADYEVAGIELDEYRTGSKKSKAVSAELDKTKAELATLQIDNQRVAADNARLLRENGSMDEVNAKSTINQQLANDRLEQRQEMETELSHVKEERGNYEKKAKKADRKAEEIKKNWNIAKAELRDVHKMNRELKDGLKKHANCPRANVAKKE
jgi:chromosome segregation ATPase